MNHGMGKVYVYEGGVFEYERASDADKARKDNYQV